MAQAMGSGVATSAELTADQSDLAILIVTCVYVLLMIGAMLFLSTLCFVLVCFVSMFLGGFWLFMDIYSDNGDDHHQR